MRFGQNMTNYKLRGKPTRVSSPFDPSSYKTERTCVAKIGEWINRITEQDFTKVTRRVV